MCFLGGRRGRVLGSVVVRFVLGGWGVVAPGLQSFPVVPEMVCSSPRPRGRARDSPTHGAVDQADLGPTVTVRDDTARGRPITSSFDSTKTLNAPLTSRSTPITSRPCRPTRRSQRSH